MPTPQDNKAHIEWKRTLQDTICKLLPTEGYDKINPTLYGRYCAQLGDEDFQIIEQQKTHLATATATEASINKFDTIIRKVKNDDELKSTFSSQLKELSKKDLNAEEYGLVSQNILENIDTLNDKQKEELFRPSTIEVSDWQAFRQAKYPDKSLDEIQQKYMPEAYTYAQEKSFDEFKSAVDLIKKNEYTANILDNNSAYVTNYDKTPQGINDDNLGQLLAIVQKAYVLAVDYGIATYNDPKAAAGYDLNLEDYAVFGNGIERAIFGFNLKPLCNQIAKAILNNETYGRFKKAFNDKSPNFEACKNILEATDHQYRDFAINMIDTYQACREKNKTLESHPYASDEQMNALQNSEAYNAFYVETIKPLINSNDGSRGKLDQSEWSKFLRLLFQINDLEESNFKIDSDIKYIFQGFDSSSSLNLIKSEHTRLIYPMFKEIKAKNRLDQKLKALDEDESVTTDTFLDIMIDELQHMAEYARAINSNGLISELQIRAAVDAIYLKSISQVKADPKMLNTLALAYQQLSTYTKQLEVQTKTLEAYQLFTAELPFYLEAFKEVKTQRDSRIVQYIQASDTYDKFKEQIQQDPITKEDKNDIFEKIEADDTQNFTDSQNQLVYKAKFQHNIHYGSLGVPGAMVFMNDFLRQIKSAQNDFLRQIKSAQQNIDTIVQGFQVTTPDQTINKMIWKAYIEGKKKQSKYKDNPEKLTKKVTQKLEDCRRGGRLPLTLHQRCIIQLIIAFDQDQDQDQDQTKIKESFIKKINELKSKSGNTRVNEVYEVAETMVNRVEANQIKDKLISAFNRGAIVEHQWKRLRRLFKVLYSFNKFTFIELKGFNQAYANQSVGVTSGINDQAVKTFVDNVAKILPETPMVEQSTSSDHSGADLQAYKERMKIQLLDLINSLNKVSNNPAEPASSENDTAPSAQLNTDSSDNALSSSAVRREPHANKSDQAKKWQFTMSIDSYPETSLPNDFSETKFTRPGDRPQGVSYFKLAFDIMSNDDRLTDVINRWETLDGKKLLEKLKDNQQIEQFINKLDQNKLDTFMQKLTEDSAILVLQSAPSEQKQTLFDKLPKDVREKSAVKNAKKLPLTITSASEPTNKIRSASNRKSVIADSNQKRTSLKPKNGSK